MAISEYSDGQFDDWQGSRTVSKPPVIIIGAPRSGTKLLRSLIAQSREMATVPYDVNYIWRMGSARPDHDELDPAMLSDGRREQIRRQLRRSAELGTGRDQRLLEKTVSNSLRVPYVASVMPDARFVFIVRNGWDATESILRSWRERPHSEYLWRKARTFPWTYAAPYAWWYASTIWQRFLGAERQVAVWGPRYKGIYEDLDAYSLAEVCGLQWAHCVTAMHLDVGAVPGAQLHVVRYETLAKKPAVEAKRIAEFVGVRDGDRMIEFAEASITSGRVGRGNDLDPADRGAVWPHIRDAMVTWGYSDTEQAWN